MKSFFTSSLLIAVMASYPLRTNGADRAPQRTKMACPELIRTMEEMSKNIKFVKPIKVTPGSWGDLPAPLRKLPAGAQMCGVGGDGQVIIVSAALGKPLEDHYAPLFAEVGCKPLKCGHSSKTNCSCSGDGGVGVLLTDTGAESYVVTFNKRTQKKK